MTRNYIPEHLRRGNELDGFADGYFLAYVNNCYAELMKIAEDCAEHDELCKIAYDWANVEYHSAFSNMYKYMSFSAILYVLMADFELPTHQFELRREDNNALAWVSANILNYNIEGMYYNKQYESEGGLDLVSYKVFLARWNSQSNSALHELGHYIHFLYVNKGIISEPGKMSSKRKAFATKYVSDYAGYGKKNAALEFIAETIAGLLVGKKYPKEIIDIFIQLSPLRRKDERYQPMVDMLNRSLGFSKLGNYVPDYILRQMPSKLDGINKRLCTYYNLDLIDYSYEQKQSYIYSEYFKYVKDCSKSYLNLPQSRLAVDLFCKIMNRSFDFIDNARLSEIEIEFIK